MSSVFLWVLALGLSTVYKLVVTNLGMQAFFIRFQPPFTEVFYIFVLFELKQELL